MTSNIRLPIVGWGVMECYMIHAIVADTRRLRVFEAMDNRAPVEVAVFANPAGGRHERDLVSDRPGRVINTASRAHQSFANHTSAVEHALQVWLREVGQPLAELLDERGSTAILLFASPRLLPMLRRCLPASLRDRVRAEMTLDLAHQPSGALRKRIEPALRTAAKQLSRPELIHRTHRIRKRSARAAAP